MKTQNRSLIQIILFFSFGMFMSCGTPSVTTFTPNGPERSIVQLEGNLLFARVIWDAGTASETILPSGFLGANFFSVPLGASVGNHDFQIERGSDRSSVQTFNVTTPRPVTVPRLDHVTIYATEFKPGNQVSTLLMVQGANVDVGADLLIDGVVENSIPYKVMINDLLGIDPTTLGFPIYHYTAMLSGTGDRPTGSSLQLQIRNFDGQLSNIVNYTLPTDAASLDSDGDNIPDDWEENGYDSDGDGATDIDLAALGADPFRRDLFLEVDIMNSLTNPPTATAFDAVIEAFNVSPIINIGADNGMLLVIDRSGSVPYSDQIDMGVTPDPSIGLVNYNNVKSANFDNAVRGRIYQYGIWARSRSTGSSGISDPGGGFTIPGDDLIVSFDSWRAAYQTARTGAETLMHEFGHNFLQRHGGSNHFTTNPTYNSVMSYTWQTRSGRNNTTRRNRPCCPPLYYGQNGATEPLGALYVPTGNIIDYSDGMGIDLVENNLDETIGVCNNIAIDWNNDGDMTDTSASRDIDGDGNTTDTHSDYCNWCFLNYRGPELNGSN